MVIIYLLTLKDYNNGIKDNNTLPRYYTRH